MSRQHKYRIIVDFETDKPLTKDELTNAAYEAFVQLDSLDEQGINVLQRDFEFEAREGACLCEEYQTKGECEHAQRLRDDVRRDA